MRSPPRFLALFLATAALCTPAPGVAKPKGKAPVAKPAADPAKPAAAPAAPEKTADKPVQPLRADQWLARLLAAIDKALAAAPPKTEQDPDPGGALLHAMARSALVSVLHGNLALAGQGQALRTGGLPAKEVAVAGREMADNYATLAVAYAELGNQKPFAGELADIFRAISALCGHAKSASEALAAWAIAPQDLGKAKAFEDALDNYRNRLQALFGSLQSGSAPSK
ncbi:MAG: hypothetical protein FJ100_21130 [Deltaproteobacteria bacterium]|nr:hypothetical protein [Deltaproteobacteria bacterium]